MSCEMPTCCLNAILHGGPYDGQEVEVTGANYQVRFARKRFAREYPVMARPFSFLAHYVIYQAVYEWRKAYDAGYSYDQSRIVGIFKGYFLDGKRVDKKGRRMKERAE